MFTAWPVIQSVFFSFTDIRNRDLRSPLAVDFVGADQYLKAFADPIVAGIEHVLTTVGR